MLLRLEGGGIDWIEVRRSDGKGRRRRHSRPLADGAELSLSGSLVRRIAIFASYLVAGLRLKRRPGRRGLQRPPSMFFCLFFLLSRPKRNVVLHRLSALSEIIQVLNRRRWPVVLYYNKLSCLHNSAPFFSLLLPLIRRRRRRQRRRRGGAAAATVVPQRRCPTSSSSAPAASASAVRRPEPQV